MPLTRLKLFQAMTPCLIHLLALDSLRMRNQLTDVMATIKKNLFIVLSSFLFFSEWPLNVVAFIEHYV